MLLFSLLLTEVAVFSSTVLISVFRGGREELTCDRVLRFSRATFCSLCLRSPPPEVRRWGNLKETLLRFQRMHDFNATFEALTVGELAGDYFNALGSHRQELLRQHVSAALPRTPPLHTYTNTCNYVVTVPVVTFAACGLCAGVPLPQCLPVGQRHQDRVLRSVLVRDQRSKDHLHETLVHTHAHTHTLVCFVWGTV